MTNESHTLHARDPHLSLLACRAAIELDELAQGKDPQLEAVPLLAAYFRNATEETSCGMERRALMDSPTINVLGRVLHAAQEPVSTVQQLATKAWETANDLSRSKVDTDKELLQRLRTFCVELSKEVAAYQQSLDSSLHSARAFRR